MKKLILNSKTTLVSNMAIAMKTAGVLVLLAMANVLSAQVDCNVTMACNDGVQVSLNADCITVITPDMMKYHSRRQTPTGITQL